MARDGIFLTYVLADLLFVVSGALLLIFALTTESNIKKAPTIENVARNLLLQMCPLKASIGNALLVFLTTLLSLPAMILPTTRFWLKLHRDMTLLCALYSMALGLLLWIVTLRTRENLLPIWEQQSSTTQSLLQREFNCCGYTNSTSPPFVVDATCPNALVAAGMVGCIGPFSSYGNNFLDLIFTGAFGIVGVDVILIMATAMLVKDRKEKERYRHIDEKNGVGAF